MTVLDVAPQVYYDAATACNTAASGLMTAFQSGMYSLKETSGMAGSVGDGKTWADSYDTRARELWKMSLDMVLALDGYASVLNQAGYNHALADHNPASGVPEPQLPTLNPAFTGSLDQLIFTLPTSAGGDGRGIVDDGLELAAKVGIPIPDGDTGKLSRAADLWNAMATHESVTAVATELERVAAMFDQVTSPDANFIDEDLRELKTAASDISGAYGEIAQACRDQKQAHDDLREQLRKTLEDLGKALLEEIAINAAIAVATSFVSFGVGAALAAAKTAKAIDRFVDLIRAVIRAGKLKTAVAVERITTKTKDTVQRIKDLTTKLVEKLKAAPKSKLSQKDIDAIGDYTEEDLGPLGYKQLNAALREGNADATQQAKINDIDTALSKLPNYDGVVYRGTDLPADVIAKYKPGEVITEDAFVSTSRNSSGSFPGNVQFEIASKTGKDIEQYSRIPNAADEAEVLFRPGSKFYVVDNYVDSSGKTIIKMAER